MVWERGVARGSRDLTVYCIHPAVTPASLQSARAAAAAAADRVSARFDRCAWRRRNNLIDVHKLCSLFLCFSVSTLKIFS